jgi:hypothetical protein
MPAGIAESCQARLVRLKPGLPFSDVWIKFQCSLAGGTPAGTAASCPASLVRLKPGLPFSDVRIDISTFTRQHDTQPFR